MSGLGMVLNIAKGALAAQQYGMNVTGNNVANVNTEGYSRQSPILEPKQGLLRQGMLLGSGVKIEQVTRSVDQFVENKLMRQKSSMLSSSEMEKYMQVLEGIFSENSGTGISSMLSDYWNLWNDISNNPSGSSERTALYEHSVLMSNQFKSLGSDLTQIQSDITNAVKVGVEKVNQITSEIVQINTKIVGMEANNVANDLRDKRNTLVSELNEYLDIKTFEQSNHSLSIVSAKGCPLVQGDKSYELDIGGSDGDRVRWQDSGGNYVDITNYITNGKLDGLLDVRDGIISKYKLDLDAMAKEFIWSVNRQHSQGAGLEGFSTVTGTYAVTDSGEELGAQDSGLNYYEKISDGNFNLWVYDSSGAAVGSPITIDADTGGTTLSSLRDNINTNVSNVTASITTNGKLKIDADSGYTLGFSDDTSNVLAALGINTFFSGSSAENISVNNNIVTDKNYIAAGRIDSTTGESASGDNDNALAMTDLQYTSMDISQWTCDRINGDTEGSVNTTIEDYYHSMVGSIGIVSSGISGDKDFNEMMVNKLNTLRSSISAVSLDEEMTNLIKYQRAYQAAAKLITVSDEMLNSLISSK